MKVERYLQTGTWTFRLGTAIVAVVGMYLIARLLVYVWSLYGSNHDLPPTWYAGLTAVLVIADIAALLFIGLGVTRVLTGATRAGKLMRTTAGLVLVVAATHWTTGQIYAAIPQWNFQNSLFDDLSWPGPGKISQECEASASQESNEKRPTSYEEVRRIARIGDWRAKQKELESRVVVGWRGWIQDVTRHGYYSNPEHHLVSLYLHDPYSPEEEEENSYFPEVVVSYFLRSEVERLAVGQEVILCGEISDAVVTSNGGMHISISRPIISPLPLPVSADMTDIPADLKVEYEVHGCGSGYECAEYSVVIDGDGRVLYEGLENVPKPGTSTGQVSKEKLKQLVFELQRTEFFSIDEMPEKLEGNPKGARIIRARMDGHSKTIILPWNGTRWPPNIDMLIGKIEEVSGLWQWLNLVKSP